MQKEQLTGIRMHTTGADKSSFTLIKILIVISIIAILSGMLIPALNAARSKAHQIICLNNSKGISFAMNGYADAFDDLTPPAVTDHINYSSYWPFRVLDGHAAAMGRRNFVTWGTNATDSLSPLNGFLSGLGGVNFEKLPGFEMKNW